MIFSEKSPGERRRSRWESRAEGALERRGTDRSKQRLTCELVVGDRRHPGIVLDVSQTGLFVQTSASPPPGERVRVKLRPADGSEFEIEASIARRYAVPARLASVARGGVGLRIESPSDDYLQLLASTSQTEQTPPPKAVNLAPPPPSSQGLAYRVRARQTSGPRSRVFRIIAVSEEEAQVAAAAELDEGWEILAVDLLGA